MDCAAASPRFVLQRFARHRLMKLWKRPAVARSAERDQSTDYIRASVRPPVCPPFSRNRLSGGSAQRYSSKILFQVENRVLAESSVQSPRHPPAYSDRIPLEELTEILRDNEPVFAHVTAVSATVNDSGAVPVRSRS